MRDTKARVVILVVLAVALLATAAASQTTLWPTYHMNSQRQGQNPDAVDLNNPAKIGLVWVFPRDVITDVDEATAIVDDTQDPALFTADPPWKHGNSPAAYTTHYYWQYAVPKTGNSIKAEWKVPPIGLGQGQLPPGNYMIAIWVPPLANAGGAQTNTTQAEYEVYDDSGGPTKVKFNQQDSGYWKPLDTRYYSFTGKSGQPLFIRLTNATYDTQEEIDQSIAAGKRITVCADAIRLIPATGQEIYSSPTSAEIDWTAINPDPDYPNEQLFSGPTPFVFVGTVEQPLVRTDSPTDSGAVYAINSVTPDRLTWDLFKNDPEAKRKREALAKFLGTTKWRYPRIDDVNARAEEEGPIEGGVYSSPTLAFTDDGNTKRLVCFVGGMDRQVHALDATTGELLWKGPGVTKGDESAIQAGTWDRVGDRSDAFGGGFSTSVCQDSATATNNITWNFPDTERQNAGEPAGTNAGLAYAVYAWIPVQAGSEKARIPDATYTITYMGSSSVTSAQVQVDQSSLANQGRWVQLGTSYFNVQSVSLSVGTGAHNYSQNAGTTPADYNVVADAVMIVPESIGPFSYSTVITDAGSTGIARKVMAANSQGRVVGFDALGLITSHNAKTYWIYPQVRQTIAPTAGSAADSPSWGEIGASPAFTPDSQLIVATYNNNEGEVHCLKIPSGATGALPTEEWVFPNSKDDPAEIPAGFTSSPAVDTMYGGEMYIGSTDGTVYCLKTKYNGGASQLKWRYPEFSASDPFSTPALLGAFRYSTPAIATDQRSTRRVWIGGSDGRIRSFLASDGRRLGIDDNGNAIDPSTATNWYSEPSVGSPIQASVALSTLPSSGGRANAMFVGDMRGVFHWYNATTGGIIKDPADGDTSSGWVTEGELFSSPSLTTVDVSGSPATWIYNGCSDGRIYAWSHAGGAWGGEWNGGNWPFAGEPNGESQKLDTLAPDTQVQFDIFPGDFYDRSTRYDPEPKIGADFTAPDTLVSNSVFWPTASENEANAWIVGRDMKVVDKSKKTEWDTDGTSGLSDDEIDEGLRKASLPRRGTDDNNHRYVMAQQARISGDGVYFEWGEKINLILWNLPGQEYMYGTDLTSKRNNVRFLFTNASAGDSSGSQTTMSGDKKVLKEYTVLDGETGSDTNGDGELEYKALKYPSSSKDVKRCYMLAQIEIKGTSSRPPSPGDGWILTAEIKRKESTKSDAPIIPEMIPLAKLEWDNKTVSGKRVAVAKLRPIVQNADADNKVQGEWDYTQQPLGINNPLGLAVGTAKVAWGRAGDGVTPDRYDPAAHINGNPPSLRRRSAPLLDLGTVPHGTTSPEMAFGVVDRSATGCNITGGGDPPDTQTLSRFRVSADDLHWHNFDNAVSAMSTMGPASSTFNINYGARLPWEQGPGSIDYPNIYKRHQAYRKVWDDQDPSRDATTLPPLRLFYDNVLKKWDNNYPDTTPPSSSTAPQLRPETIYVSVDVPRFQPANMPVGGSYRQGGYSRGMEAYIDSDGDRGFDSGTSILGRPSTYQEAYREFQVGIGVPPDPRIEVEEQLIDIGRAPHGLGEAMPQAYNAYNNDPNVRQWFKTLTIKNAGNVNLTNLHIGKMGYNQGLQPWYLELFSDQANPSSTLPGFNIVSSLDQDVMPFNAPPFTTASLAGGNLGYTLSKPRVGDPDPTVMTIPDRRKWDTNYNLAQDQMRSVMASAPPEYKWPDNQPLPVKVGLVVPLTQPLGTYGSWDPITKQPLSIPVFADVKAGSGGLGNGALDFGEPFSDPSFQLTVTVRENQLTGGVTPFTLPQIDLQGDPKVFGDASPAAFRDPATGDVHLFWSSNRVYDAGLLPTGAASDFASAPWFIDRATLRWGGDTDGWLVGPDGSRWWDTPMPDATSPYLPDFQWPSTLMLQDPGAHVMEWPPASGDLLSVRHFSPFVAENRDRITANPDADKGLQWLAWAGTADVMTGSNKTAHENRIFYTDATHGVVTDSTGQGQAQVYSIEHDPSMAKRYPYMAVFTDAQAKADRMWMFWQGGHSGKWSIYYSINKEAPSFPSLNHKGDDVWSADTILRTPDSLSSVSAPNALHRLIGENRDDMFDVIYSGVGKLTQNSDVLLGHYVAQENNGDSFSPGRRALPLPRVFAEQLERDQKFGFFTSQHIAWLRLSRGQTPLIDDWGNYNVADPNPDLPYIHVVLPAGYKYGDGTTIPGGTVVSGTDGSIYSPDKSGVMQEVVAPTPITPEMDDATGVYTYKYPDQKTRDILGEMLVDFSAGIVRFTKPLPEIKGTDGVVNTPKVVADYTPQTWRLTTDLAADSSPRAFIERTPMNDSTSPGLVGPNAPVDRLWVFWKKAGTSVDSSTVYYKTYRMGVDISRLRDAGGSAYPAIPMNGNGTPDASLSISGNIGSAEVDRTGKRIYFTEVDERYRPALKAGVPGFANVPVQIEYKIGNKTIHIDVSDIYWIEELPEQALFGFAADGAVNEGSICAFADPAPKARDLGGTFKPVDSSKIWVFWTSTRSGTSDLFWETISPDFTAR